MSANLDHLRPVTINVGGVIFKSTIKTLLRIGLLRAILCPTSDSTAIAWCSGNVITPTTIKQPQTIISEGDLDALEVTEESHASLDFQFFDRSPTIFSEILDFSRCNSPVICKMRNLSVYSAECDYWGYPWTLSGNSDYIVVINEGIKKYIPLKQIEDRLKHYLSHERSDQILFFDNVKYQ